MPIDEGMGSRSSSMGVYGECLEERSRYKAQRDKLRKRANDLSESLEWALIHVHYPKYVGPDATGERAEELGAQFDQGLEQAKRLIGR